MTACGSANNGRQIWWEQQTAREISFVVAPGSFFGIPVIKKVALRVEAFGCMESIVYLPGLGKANATRQETRAHRE